MADEAVYASLGKLTEEMYMSLAKAQSSRMQDQLVSYHAFAEEKISTMMEQMGRCDAGEMLKEHNKKLHILRDDFRAMKHDINSKYKIYLRGCGNAGKSTLLNALLSLDESKGSRMSRLPKTFIIDTYIDELPVEQAEVRTIRADGGGEYQKMSRMDAIRREDKEEERFAQSKEKCRKEIEKACKNAYLEHEKADIEREIYTTHLLKTNIREIRWGIGKNSFFHNCILIDTPGLSQELRFTNVLEDVKSYEVDGIIWVISSESLFSDTVPKAYKEEMKEMQAIYDGRKIIAVINMYGTGKDYTYGSDVWKELEESAKEIFCDELKLFADLVCVNAKLAYDGNKSGNAGDIEKSNISELRKAINEMFVERSTEAYHYAKLEKIDRFLDNLYRDTKGIEQELQDKAEEYQDKHDEISRQKTACGNMVRESVDKALSTHLSGVKERIAQNSEAVQTLGQMPEWERDSFVQNKIACTDVLKRHFEKVLEECAPKVYSSFQKLQEKSIISGFQSESYKLQHFEKANEVQLLGKSNTLPPVSYPRSGWDVSVAILKEIIEGRSSVTKLFGAVLVGFKNMFKSPQDRLYESVSDSLGSWARKWNLSEQIEQYASVCRETVDQSMAQTCCAHQDLDRLLPEIGGFNKEKPQMQWEEAGLEKLIGGCLS